jgi:CarboxypepD_reg-like domain
MGARLTMLEMSIVSQQVAIAGRVLEGETESSISGAIVEIVAMPEKFRAILSLKALQYGSQWEKMHNSPNRRITTSDGSFHFINLPPGEYILEVSFPVNPNRYNKVQKTVKVSAAVNGKIPTMMLDILLSVTGIKGIITDAEEANKLIANAKVQIQGSRESCISNQKGNYRLLGLEPSKSGELNLNLIVSAIGYQEVSKSVVIKRGEVITEQNFSLKRK